MKGLGFGVHGPGGEAVVNSSSPGCFLFVGGPLDGQVRDVPSTTRRWHVPIYEQRSSPGPLQSAVGKITVEQAEYVREPIHVEGGRMVLHLYRYSGMRMAEVVLRLMAAYADKNKG
jgi:hypothetical protein